MKHKVAIGDTAGSVCGPHILDLLESIRVGFSAIRNWNKRNIAYYG